MSLILALLAGTAPSQWVPPPEWPVDEKSPCEIYVPVRNPDQLTIAGIGFFADEVAEVTPGIEDYNGMPIVTIVFTEAGMRKFRFVQTGRVGQHLPICIGAEPLTVPVLNELIFGDSVQISGVYAVSESNALADRIKGALRTRPVGR